MGIRDNEIQFWFREDKPGVIFLMNTESLDQAKAIIHELPLAANGFLGFELFGECNLSCVKRCVIGAVEEDGKPVSCGILREAFVGDGGMFL